MRNAFNGPTTKLNIAEDRISELENLSIEIFKT